MMSATAVRMMAGALAIACTHAHADEPRSAFRPCIDPANLPFANEHGDGFENRIAALFAQKLGLPVKSYSFPQRMNFIRNTLRYRLPGEDYRCDVVMSLPVGFEQAAATQPYYRSTYALVYPKGKGLDSIRSGNDLFALPPDVRNRLRIGIYDKSPASQWLVKHGMEAQAKPYPILSPDPDNSPGDIIEKDWYKGVASPIRMERTKPSLRRTPPKFSQHTSEVLGEFGYSQSEIEVLVANGAVCGAERKR